jgi:RHS repeat-associated protein
MTSSSSVAPRAGRVSALVVLVLASVVAVFAPQVGSTEPAGSPRTETSALLEPGSPDSGTRARAELVARRTEASRTFVTPTGEFETELGAGPLHYRDARGAWQPIDARLVESAMGWQTRANTVRLSVPKTLDEPVELASPKGSISFELQPVEAGSASAPSSADSVEASTALDSSLGAKVNEAIQFPVSSEVDVVYEPLTTGVKETVVLASPAASRSFDFTTTLSPGLQLRPNEAGGIDVIDAAGEVVMQVAEPFAIDAAGVEGPAHLRMVMEGGVAVLRLSGDEAWLADPARRWPVQLDPTTTFQGSTATIDCYVSQSNPTGSACAGASLRAGLGSSSDRRNALLQFPDVTTVIPEDAMVGTGSLRLTHFQSSTANNVTLKAFRIDDGWTTGADWNTAGGDFDNSTAVYNDVEAVSVTAGASVAGNLTWRFNQLAQDWVSGKVANQGVMIRHINSTPYNTLDFRSSEYATSSQQPLLTVAWRDRHGRTGSSTFDDINPTDRSVLGVNVANRNLHYGAQDFSIRGTGLDLSIEHYYSSLNSNTSKWSFNVGADTDLAVDDQGVLYRPAIGGSYRFNEKASAANTWWEPPGLNASLSRVTSSKWTLTFKKDKSKITFETKGAKNVPTRYEDRNGNYIQYSYTLNGTFPELTSITDTQGRVVTVGWTAGKITSITDSTGRATSYTWSGNNITVARDAANNDTTFSYDAQGELAQVATPEDRRTKVGYVSTTDDRVAVIDRVHTNPSSAYRIEWNLVAGKTERVETAFTPSHTTTFTFDTTGRVTDVKNDEGDSISVTTWSDNDDAETITNDLGGETALTYTNNILSSIQAPSSGGSSPGITTIRGTGSDPYLPTSVTDPQNACTKYGYTSGNLTSVRTGLTGNCDSASSGGDLTTIARNSKGAVDSVTDPYSNVTDYLYDLAEENLTGIDYPGTKLGDITLTVDALSRVSTVSDGKGDVTRYEYDAIDRVTRITYDFDGTNLCPGWSTCADPTYDGDGNMISRQDNRGTTTFDFDKLGRPTAKGLPSGANACSSGGTKITMGYDAANNLTSVCDAHGTTTYTYDTADDLTEIKEAGANCGAVPATNCTLVDFDRDTATKRVTYPVTGNVENVFKFHDSGATDYVEVRKDGSTVLTVFDYDYRNATGGDTQLRTSVTESNFGSPDVTTSYQYDARNRLCWAYTGTSTNSCASPPSGATSWTYDQNGNRTRQNAGGTITSYGYDTASNELCWVYSGTSSNACGSAPSGATTFTHNLNGDMTGSTAGFAATYNPRRQTVSWSPPGGSSTNFTYTGFDSTERVAIGTTNHYDGPLGLSRSVDASSNTITWTRDPDGRVVSQARSIDSGTKYYYLYDGLGSIIGMVNSSGNVVNKYRYDAWGNLTTTTEAVPNPFRYAGGYFDHATSTKFGTRYYNPTQGRWTQQDPIAGALASPNSLNRYAYAGNNPVSQTDRTGYLFGIDCPFGEYEDGGCVGGSINDRDVVEDLALGVSVNFFVSSLCTAIVAGVSGGSLTVAGYYGCTAAGTVASQVAQAAYDG